MQEAKESGRARPTTTRALRRTRLDFEDDDGAAALPVAMILIARKRASLSAAAAGLEGVTTLRTAKQRLESRPHTRPTMLKLTCQWHVTFALASCALKIMGAAATSGMGKEGLASATLASQTPNRMGRVASATRHGTAAPMQAETRTCSRVMCNIQQPSALHVTHHILCLTRHNLYITHPR